MIKWPPYFFILWRSVCFKVFILNTIVVFVIGGFESALRDDQWCVGKWEVLTSFSSSDPFAGFFFLAGAFSLAARGEAPADRFLGVSWAQKYYFLVIRGKKIGWMQHTGVVTGLVATGSSAVAERETPWEDGAAVLTSEPYLIESGRHDTIID
jgi:hypothetical protein